MQDCAAAFFSFLYSFGKTTSEICCYKYFYGCVWFAECVGGVGGGGGGRIKYSVISTSKPASNFISSCRYTLSRFLHSILVLDV